MTGVAAAQNLSLSHGYSPPFTADAGVSAGIAWGDFNNDLYPDIFVANWGQDNMLYRNNGDGSFTRITDSPVKGNGEQSSGACWGDYDNDGWLDLFVANQSNENNLLYHNNGDGTFTQVLEGDIVTDYGDSYSAAWADYNNDGWLDLYVPNSNQPNFLYRGNGDGTFTAVYDDPAVQHVGSSFGASWGDYDGDGYVDLFVSERGPGQNRLYHNEQGNGFVDVTETMFGADSSSSNGGSWGDFDNDGDLDLFVANGQWFFTGYNNFLYRNNGDAGFEKITASVVVNDSSNSMSGCWIDLENDGDLDLMVTTYVQNNVLYVNQGDGSFVRNSALFDVNFAGYTTGLGAGDLDLDGDLDLALANWENQNNSLLLNQNHGNNWLTVVCRGEKSNRDGLGARLQIFWTEGANQRTRVTEIASNFGFRSMSDLKAHFGIGGADRVDSLTVRWPGGVVDVLKDLPANQLITVGEGKGIVDTFQPPAPPVQSQNRIALSEAVGDRQDAIVALLDSLCEYATDSVDCSEASVVSFGYALLFGGRQNDARLVFERGTEMFPSSANMQDCVAESCEALGDSQGVLDASKRVLELLDTDPTLSEQMKTSLGNTAGYRLKRYDR